MPAPTVDLHIGGQSSIQIGGGQPFILSWSSSNATSCTASGQWSGSKVTSGSQNMTSPLYTGNYLNILTCSNAYDSTGDGVVVYVDGICGSGSCDAYHFAGHE